MYYCISTNNTFTVVWSVYYFAYNKSKLWSRGDGLYPFVVWKITISVEAYNRQYNESLFLGCCKYHPGAPVFHDAIKRWSCCKKSSTDFTEFLNTPVRFKPVNLIEVIKTTVKYYHVELYLWHCKNINTIQTVCILTNWRILSSRGSLRKNLPLYLYLIAVSCSLSNHELNILFYLLLVPNWLLMK